MVKLFLEAKHIIEEAKTMTSDQGLLEGDVTLKGEHGKVSRAAYLAYMKAFDLYNANSAGQELLLAAANFAHGNLIMTEMVVKQSLIFSGLSDKDGNLSREMVALLRASLDDGKLCHPAEMVELGGKLFLAEDVYLMRGTLMQLSSGDNTLYSAMLLPFSRAIDLFDRSMYTYLNLVNENGSISELVQLIILEIENEKKEK